MNKSALIIVDMQVDFCENGSLEVKNANQIIDGINDLRSTNFNLVILTQDFHPHDHISFINSPHINTSVHLDTLTNKWKV